MKDFKEEHIDPEQYWPEAASLLENHYKAKRRRRAIVLVGVVLIGLIGVFVLNTEKINLTENRNHDNKEVVNNVIEQNNSVTPNENDLIIPSAQNEESITESKEVNQAPVLESERGIATNAPNNYASSNTIYTRKSIAKNKRNKKNSISAIISSEQFSSAPLNTTTPINTLTLPIKEKQEKQSDESNLTVPAGIVQNNINGSIITETNFTDVEFISSMPLLKWEKTLKEEVSYQIENRPALLNKKRAKWDLLVYGGVNEVQKELSGKSSPSYLLRREKEETPALLPFGGLQLSKSINNWDFRGGVEFAVVGEQVKYSPYSKGDYLNVYDDWIPNNYTVTDTDSSYIWGILFLNTTDFTVFDSVKVTKTDTLNGVHYNSNIRNANGINRWYVMELPLEVLYQFRMKRWGIGVSAGLSPGFIVQSSGYYLKEDESGYTSIKKYNKHHFTLNARAGIEVSYLLNTRCRILLRPMSQYSLVKMDAGANQRQRYRRNGISLGLLYMIP